MRKRSGTIQISISALAQASRAEVIGSKESVVERICPADEIRSQSLSFISGSISPELLEDFCNKGAVAVFCNRQHWSKALELYPTLINGELRIAVLIVEDAFLAIISCIPFFYEPHAVVAGIHSLAFVDPSATVDPSAAIDAFCYVGAGAKIEAGVTLFPHTVIYAGAQIGQGSTIHSGAVIREDCVVGPQSVIQNGAVIGADGFGYRPDPKEGLVAFPQVGITRLSPRVDVGANACVDRGALGDTIIGLGTKIDNLVQVGHNTKIGSHSVLCGLVGVSGSCTIGDQVTLAGGVGVADHVTIPSKTRFGARSGVTGSVREPGDYAGFPVVKASEWRRQAAALRSLPEVLREMRRALKKLTSESEE